MSQHQDLTDAQWEVLHLLVPEPERREDGRGRPWKGRREVLNGILYILRTGAAWAELPDRYPPYQTCHRRFRQWVRTGVMRHVLEALAEEELHEPQPAPDEGLYPRVWRRVSDVHLLGDGASAPSQAGSPALLLLERRIQK